MPRSAAAMLDLSALPAPRQREVRDFAQFLLTRCAESKKTVRTKTLPAAFQTPLQVQEYLKVSRDEIYDEI